MRPHLPLFQLAAEGAEAPDAAAGWISTAGELGLVGLALLVILALILKVLAPIIAARFAPAAQPDPDGAPAFDAPTPVPAQAPGAGPVRTSFGSPAASTAELDAVDNRLRSLEIDTAERGAKITTELEHVTAAALRAVDEAEAARGQAQAAQQQATASNLSLGRLHDRLDNLFREYPNTVQGIVDHSVEHAVERALERVLERK